MRGEVCTWAGRSGFPASRFPEQILPDMLRHLGDYSVMLLIGSRRSAFHRAWRALVFTAWLCNPAALLMAQVRMEFPDGTEVRPGRLWKAQVVWDGPATRWAGLEFAWVPRQDWARCPYRGRAACRQALR